MRASHTNTSSLTLTFQGCGWEERSTISSIGTSGATHTLDNPSSATCLDLCYLYGQWINGGGTWYTYWGIFTSCPHVHFKAGTTLELYGEHAVTKNGFVSNTGSTDAVYHP